MLKEEVLKLLEENRGSYVSGGKIAKTLGVSRNAVWKVIQALEQLGYKFEKSTRLGYKLLEDNDKLSSTGIRKYLKEGYVRSIEVHDELSSTNDYVMAKASRGEADGLLVVAERQVGGKGRFGRSFHSPEGGVYFSLLVRPDKSYKGNSFLTVMAAVSVVEALKEVYGVSAGIKWVNDIFIDGKKCSGILTEASIDFESGSVAYAVIGIGINLKEQAGGFPEEIKDIACAVDVEAIDGKNRIVAAVINNLLDYINLFEYDKTAIIDKYRSRSIMTGKRVIIKRESGDREALCLGINDECQLIVRYPSGKEETIYCGEVSLCIKD